MNFGDALAVLRGGGQVSRAGWNGPGQYVALMPGFPAGVPIHAHTAKATGVSKGTVCRFRPYLLLRTAQGDFVPWQPTVDDVLAEDWDA